MNNPYASDKIGPGAVEPPGLAALDPRNGMPLTWNPTRARGYGVFDFTVTANGLWMGHDTNQVHAEAAQAAGLLPAGRRQRRIPAEVVGTLPGNAYLLRRLERQHRLRGGHSTAASVTSTSAVADGGQAWGTSRASFVIDGVLYTGWSNKTLTTRSVQRRHVRCSDARSTSTR